MKVKSESEVAQLCPTLCDPMDCSPPGSSIHGIFPGKSTGVGCQCLLRNPILESLKRQNKNLALAQLAGESYRDSYLLNLLNLGYILER